MKKISFLVAAMVCLLPSFLAAEDKKPVVLFSPLNIEGISADEGRFIENLMLGYINTLGEVLTSPDYLDNAEYIRPLTDERIPDYTFSGRITRDKDGHILIIEVGMPGTGETVSFSSVHRNTGELILRVRSVVELAFTGGAAAFMTSRTEKPDITKGEPLSEGKIAGAWRGEPGIEMVRLQQGGRGLAVFSSGVRMDLSYSIENNTLKVVQDSPNTERYYQRLGDSPATVPYAVAEQLVLEAEPMYWEFLLQENGMALRGIKIFTGVRYESETVLEIIPGTNREVEWTRTGR
jgi:hypothetical protein